MEFLFCYEYICSLSPIGQRYRENVHVKGTLCLKTSYGLHRPEKRKLREANLFDPSSFLTALRIVFYIKDTLVNRAELDHGSRGGSVEKESIVGSERYKLINRLIRGNESVHRVTGNTIGGVRYQVDSRHSRVKWIGPYEAGRRVAKQTGAATVKANDDSRLSRWLFNYDDSVGKGAELKFSSLIRSRKGKYLGEQM